MCQRPFPIAIHEQQSVTLRQTCPSAKARDTEQCLNTEIAASCDVTTLAGWSTLSHRTLPLPTCVARRTADFLCPALLLFFSLHLHR